MRSKIPKMLSHQFINADWYIWIDSKFIINNNFFIDDIISNADNKKLILFKHPDRKNISEEVDFNLSLIKTSSYLSSRYKNEPIKQQFEKYIQDKNFKDDKLFSMGFFAYHKDLKELMNLWFYENCLWTLHDQISFPYVLQKYNSEYKILNCNILDNPWFTHRTILKTTDRYTLLQSYIKSFL